MATMGLRACRGLMGYPDQWDSLDRLELLEAQGLPEMLGYRACRVLLGLQGGLAPLGLQDLWARMASQGLLERTEDKVIIILLCV